MPTMQEIRALAELPALRHLVLCRPEPVADLRRLRTLDTLRIIELHEVPPAAVSAAEEAIGAGQDVLLKIHSGSG